MNVFPTLSLGRVCTEFMFSQFAFLTCLLRGFSKKLYWKKN